MTTIELEKAKLHELLNTAQDLEDMLFELVGEESETEGGDKKPPKDKIEFEDVGNRLVHLYDLGVDRFTYNASNGNEVSLVEQSGEAIQVLDFQNQSGEAINGWRVSFTNPDLELTQDNVVNAKLSQEGDDRWVFSSVKANARISAGESLSNKIIFKAPLINGQIAIAYDFRVHSARPSSDIDPVDIPASKGKYNYADVLAKTLYGVTWQTQGKKPSWNTNPHRGDCFLDDGSHLGWDLSGGVGDAGDAIKPNYAAGINACQYLFTGIFYPEVYEATGQLSMLDSVARWYLDYFLKCHRMSNGRTNQFVQWCSFNDRDHKISLPYEKQGAEYKRRGWRREADVLDANNRGTEPCVAVAAAWAFGAVFYKDRDPAYAKKLIENAKALYAFGDERHVKYKPKYVYKSVSGSFDELCLGAIALYMATKENHYLQKAEHYFKTKINYPG